MSILTDVLNTVVENGRVRQNEDGSFNASSMGEEIEYECADRNLDDATTAECIAFALSGKDVG